MIRRYFALALRDVLPLDERGWTVWTHTNGCPAPHGHAFSACRGSQAAFIQRPAVDTDHADALVELSRIVDTLTERDEHHRLPPPNLPMGQASFVIVSTAVDEDEDDDARRATFDRAFELVQRCVDGLRHATWSRVPALTLERLWPTFLVLEQRSSGPPQVIDFDTIQHGTFFKTTRPATMQQLEQAESFIVASFNRDPVENFRYLHLAARNAGVVEGDYIGAVLKAAAAAEILIKHTAAMLIWEVTHYGKPAPWASKTQPLAEKPSTLVSSVLAPALKGNWSSQHTHQAVGAWRHHIAKKRNQVIHHGHRPTADEVDSALNALNQLVKHVSDRLAAAATQYPRTAIMTAGKFGLERRGAWEKVQDILVGSSVDTWRETYRTWLDSTHTSDLLTD